MTLNDIREKISKGTYSQDSPKFYLGSRIYEMWLQIAFIPGTFALRICGQPYNNHPNATLPLYLVGSFKVSNAIAPQYSTFMTQKGLILDLKKFPYNHIHYGFYIQSLTQANILKSNSINFELYISLK